MKLIVLLLLIFCLPLLQALDCPTGSKAKTWVQAHEECESTGVGHMVEASDHDEAKGIFDFAKITADLGDGGKRWWLGLNDIMSEGDWRWAHSYSNGSVQTSDFASIWTPKTTADNLDDCVVMKNVANTLAWEDIHCDLTADTSENIQVLCQCKGDECTAPTPTPEPISCGDANTVGWIAWEGLGCVKPLDSD